MFPLILLYEVIKKKFSEDGAKRHKKYWGKMSQIKNENDPLSRKVPQLGNQKLELGARM